MDTLSQLHTWHCLILVVFSWLVLSLYLSHPALGSSSNVSVQCLETERQALLEFKDGIKTDYCGLLTSWGGDPDCCQWRGIRCSNHTGHIISLSVGGPRDFQCLVGKVSPSSFSEFRHLRQLNLSSNDLEGFISPQLGNLSKLTTLDLSDSCLNGGESLEWLSRLSSLRYLDLSGTDLSKITNWMQIVSNLPSLSILRMDDSLLTALTPSPVTYVNSSASLRAISLSDNYFNDTSILFEWLFSLPGITTRLVYLDLSGNNLHGPIPVRDAFRYMQHISYLDLSYNRYLEGPISSEVWNMPSLTYLSLSKNNFQGSIFKICSKLCNLRQLYLAENNFTDELADVIQTGLGCADQVLITLDLTDNRFSGSIPDSISSFSSLRELYLDGNQLNGNISQGIGHLSKLERLYIASNSFQGSLTSEHFSNLSSLQEFSSWNNPKLVVNISGNNNGFPPSKLDILNLGGCMLGPRFPAWLQTHMNLSFLDISSAVISDRVPASFWNSLSPNLQHLNMSFNQMYGVIPNLPAKFHDLSDVDLSSNLFQGVVPSWLSNVYSLYLNDNRFSDSTHILCPENKSRIWELDLSNNFFSEELPDCWINFNKLTSLHLENNELHGRIPESIGTLKNLKYLHLYNNSLSGHLPASLRHCTSLVILNLGYNSFTGYIPSWTGNAFRDLGAVSLRRNKFRGELSSSLCQLSKLQILDLSVNNISGTIPKCIHHLAAMREKAESTLDFYGVLVNIGYQPMSFSRETEIVTWKREEQRFKDSLVLVKSIDLSNNELHGEIPDGIVSLTGLVSLDLSGNRLSGSFPSEIGNLTALQLLDFSDNQLSGEVPPSLTKLNALEILGLSNNNLSGEIPISTQLQTFNASSYSENPELCGAPLPECPRDQATSNPLRGVNSTNVQDEHDEYGVFPGLYISVVLGFIIGFWGVCGTLVIKRSWRPAYFRLLQDIHDRFLELAMSS